MWECTESRELSLLSLQTCATRSGYLKSIEYVKAGAGLIRTNTFAANTASLDADTDYVISNVRAAVKLAKQAADGEA